MEQVQTWNKLEIKNCINKIKSSMTSSEKSHMAISALSLLDAVRMQNKNKEKHKIMKQAELRHLRNIIKN